MGPKKKTVGAGLGSALLRHRFNRGKEFQHANFLHTTELDEDMGGPGLQSVIERNDLDEMLAIADLAGKDYTAEREAVVVLKSEPAVNSLSQAEKAAQRKEAELLNQERLRIPRRPKWHTGMSPDELDKRERESFLEWRRALVALEEDEKLVLTPFEKNLDVWRQLWRVVERSDLVVMVVDSRNPLFYRCEDLERYASEDGRHRRTMLLLNKADLLPPHIRLKWACWLQSRGISFLFWSAKDATAVLEGKPSIVAPAEASQEDADDEELIRVLGREELLHRLEAAAEEVVKNRQAAESTEANSKERVDNDPSVMNEAREEVKASAKPQKGKRQPTPERVVVGFVGYPNVGKSSTINALVGAKKTGVTSTPGKTKHFQTLLLENHPRLMLCDCPGLVFPSFSSSKEEMVAAGVLPIDRLTDHRGPVGFVAERVPRADLERTLGIVLPLPAQHEDPNRKPTGAEVMRAFCRARGYVGSQGLPDETRAARYILKEYVDGRLLHHVLPPGEEPEEWSRGSAEEGGPEGESSEQEEGESGSEELEAEAETPSRTAGGASASTADTSKMDDEFDVLEELEKGGLPRGIRASKLRGGPTRPAHKMNKKGQRTKDRSWRVGRKEDQDVDGMPVNVVVKPVSHGAASRASVLPAEQARRELQVPRVS